MRNKFIYILLLIFLFGCSSQQDRIKRTTISMGTTIEIQVIHNNNQVANEAINSAFEEVERINRKYSTYIDSNYIWVINNSGVSELKVDDETFYLLQKCNEFYEATNGGFDAAIGTYIDILGFETDNPDEPTITEIQSALEKVGWKHIELLENNLIRKIKPVKINFGAIAKGYAVDRMAEILRNNGIKKFLINAGGELIGEGNDWTIGIQHPRKKNELLGKVILNNISVATSGDYEQFFEKKNKRFHHIINPKTGLPSLETQAVTIISEKNVDADALATGVFVIGPVEGLKIIESLKNVEGLIVDSSGTIIKSSGFDQYFRR